jgi:filamentous hemagglutinin
MWTLPGVGPLWDLSLDATHTFAVGDVQAVVHNCGGGVPEDASYAPKTYGPKFKGGKFAGESVDDVAAGIKKGEIDPEDLQVGYIRRDGNTLILNTRSATALTKAEVPRALWNGIDQTGDPLFERLLDGQLERNGLTSEGIDIVRRSGGY